MTARGTTGLQVLARARVADPLPSVRAARDANDSGRANGQAAWFLDRVTREPGLTASELAAAGPFDRYAANRRLADLERRGFIQKGESRASAETGRLECTWWKGEGEKGREGESPAPPVMDEKGQVVLL